MVSGVWRVPLWNWRVSLPAVSGKWHASTPRFARMTRRWDVGVCRAFSDSHTGGPPGTRHLTDRPAIMHTSRRSTMTDGPRGVDRRRFLKRAATGAVAAAAQTPMDAQKQAHDHDHEHQAVPSDPALRTKALESLLVEKGLV